MPGNWGYCSLNKASIRLENYKHNYCTMTDYGYSSEEIAKFISAASAPDNYFFYICNLQEHGFTRDESIPFHKASISARILSTELLP